MIKVSFELDQELFPEATQSIIEAILIDGFKRYVSFEPITIKIEEVSDESFKTGELEAKLVRQYEPGQHPLERLRNKIQPFVSLVEHLKEIEVYEVGQQVYDIVDVCKVQDIKDCLNDCDLFYKVENWQQQPKQQGTYEEKSIEWWLDQLDEPYRTQALENHKNNPLIASSDKRFYNFTSTINALNFAFEWGLSKQGLSYWEEFYHDLKDAEVKQDKA